MKRISVLLAISYLNVICFAGLFREGLDTSKVQQTFAGPACAKGRVTPEFEDFFDGTGLVLTPRYPAISSVEYDPRKIEGLQSTKLNIGGTDINYFSSTLSPALNWKHKSIKIRFYIPPVDHNIMQVTISMLSEGVYTSYLVWRYSYKSPRTGWLEYSFTPTNGYNSGNLAVVDSILIGAGRQNSEQPAYILVNGLTVWDGRLKMPLYCCTFDDNYVLQYEAAMYALSRGVPVSLFINKNRSDGFGVSAGTEGMTLAQNQALEQAGCIHINHGVSHSPPLIGGSGVNNLWSSPDTPIADLIADIELNRQWMNETGLGFGAGIFGSPQEWWLDLHEQNLKPYMFGRPRQGRGMGTYGLLTMWDENTEVRAACDTNLANARKMLKNNVGTLFWTPGTYPAGTLREWIDGKIYEVADPNGTSEGPPHTDWTCLRDRGPEDEGDRAIQIDVWHHFPDGHAGAVNEGSFQDFKDYIDVIAAHIAAGRLRAMDIRELYESYLYTTKPANSIQGDLNFDGIVNLDDFVIMSDNWLVEKES
jgi:hypothetical protein